MGYRILSQNNSPTPSAISPVPSIEPISPAPPCVPDPGWFGLLTGALESIRLQVGAAGGGG